MHGLGNDFVVLDLISQNVSLRREQIRALADRREGVGFDQLLTIEPPTHPDFDFFYRIYNADGTEAEQCGNGARCVLRFVRDRGLTTRTSARFQTKNGCMTACLQRDGKVTVDMGPPRLAPEQVPLLADSPAITYTLNLPATCTSNLATPGAEKVALTVGAVSMGNPHAVIVVDDVASAPVDRIGRAVEQHKRFPERANVGFMEVLDRTHIRLRVFERGVGETRACGSGACAAVVSGRLQGLLDESVTVDLEGGSLDISWAGDNAPVYMTGPVNHVYEGRLQI